MKANNFGDAMSKKTDSDLLKIVTGSADDYQPAALEAAKREYEKRKFSAEKIATAQQRIESDQIAKSFKAEAPLATGWKVLTFIFLGIIQILFSGTFNADGYDRKAKELLTWTLYGFGSPGLSFLFPLSEANIDLIKKGCL